MFPTHPPTHGRHAPSAASTAAAAAVAAQASPYFHSYPSYHSHHQQFASSQYPNLSDLNSNMYSQFSTFDSASQSPSVGVATGSPSPSWHSQWTHPSPFGSSSRGYGTGTGSGAENGNSDSSWSQTAADIPTVATNDTGSHSPTNTPTSSDANVIANTVPTSSSTGTAVPPSSGSPGFTRNSQSSDSPSGTPTPSQLGNFSGGGQMGSEMFSKAFQIHAGPGSPVYGSKHDPMANAVAVVTSSPSSHFSIPTCLTVTPQDCQALSPDSISPSTPTATVGLTSRPQPARSPYEWMKKPSYQSQPEKNGKYLYIVI